MVKLLILLFFSFTLYAKTFTVATYNVENFFDLNNNITDYKEYTTNNKSKWNKKNFDVKVSNLLKVLKDLNCDIVALQEVENKELMQLLVKRLPEYKYYSFSKYEKGSVGVGFLSKIEIERNSNLNVRFSDKIYRPILETTFKIDDNEFKIFNNHWPSKKVGESYRIKYAKKLFDRVNELPRDYDYILLGDFNSNYNEFETIYQEKRLNNTQGVTGINQVLNTTIDKEPVTVDDVLRRDKRAHYNLWLDLPQKNRFSTIFRGKKNTPDNIIIPPALFDNKKLSYKIDSFKVFRPSYLYKNGKINRWQMRNKVHQGIGFSDHLPLMATFSSNDEDKSPLKNLPLKTINKISNFYEIEKLIEPVDLKDVIVIYKNNRSAIIKQKNDRAIFLFNNAAKLDEGFSYDLRITQIKEYFGLKEIKSFRILHKNQEVKEYKKLYKNAEKIDIFDSKNQNEIVTNLKGTYKDGKLFFKDENIKLYSKKKILLPENNQKVEIKRAHLGLYKDEEQLIIYDKSDINVN